MTTIGSIMVVSVVRMVGWRKTTVVLDPTMNIVAEHVVRPVHHAKGGKHHSKPKNGLIIVKDQHVAGEILTRELVEHKATSAVRGAQSALCYRQAREQKRKNRSKGRDTLDHEHHSIWFSFSPSASFLLYSQPN